ncbi:MAG: hypothetical protein RIG68_03035 [Imperialibacter sp.]|uniref:hypothetical protein n=1 Tax=Imperialibacter sp. TaxID=2038411 RepID=UPI0032EB95C9
MEFSYFKKFFWPLGYFNHRDKTAITQLLDSTYEESDYELFSQELRSNVVASKNKNDVVKLYIFELLIIQYEFYERRESLLSLEYASEYVWFVEDLPDENQYSALDLYLIKSHQIISSLIEEIQITCELFSINFDAICRDLGFYYEPFKSDVYKEFAKTPMSQKIRQARTLIWQGEYSELKVLYQKLRVSCIEYETKEEVFLYAFSGAPIDPEMPAIKWCIKVKLIAYFLDKCFNGNWQATIGQGNLFMNEKGKLITSSDLSSALKEAKAKDVPGQQEIDLILSEIKNNDNS